MEETVRTHRLSKVAIEFNIKVDTVVKFLSNKGIKIDSNPNGKITEQMYEMLQKEFQSEKQLKETSKKLDIGISRHETVTLDKAKEREIDSDLDKDLFIKNVPVTFSKEPEKHVEKSKEELKKLDEPQIKKPVEEIIQIVTEPEKPVDTKPAEKPHKKESVSEEPTKVVEENRQEISEPGFEQIGPKVLRTIDLEKVNSKKPSKKTAEEKKIAEKAKEEASTDVEPKVVEKPAKKSGDSVEKSDAIEEIVATTQNDHAIILDSQVDEPDLIPHAELESEDEKLDKNFITTQYTVLEGVTILGKIDLPAAREPQKKQPVASSSDEKGYNKKKKRKRIKSEETPVEKTSPQTGVKTNQATGANVGASQKPGFKKQKGKTILRPEVSDEDIQKQIRETLARLSGPSKSKASKYRRQKRDAFQQQVEEEQLKLEEDKKTLSGTA